MRAGAPADRRPTSSASAARTPSRPSRSASSRASGRRRRRRRWPARQRARLRRERLAQQPLDAVAVDRAADLARHRQAERGPPRRGRLRARGNAYTRGSGCRCERPWRYTRSNSALREAGPRFGLPAGARGARPRSDRQPLAALVAAALERQAAGARLHARCGTRGRGRACASWAGRCASWSGG